MVRVLVCYDEVVTVIRTAKVEVLHPMTRTTYGALKAGDLLREVTSQGRIASTVVLSDPVPGTVWKGKTIVGVKTSTGTVHRPSDALAIVRNPPVR